ncbi:T9SS type A sorting domain-containing protein [Chitinophaga sancti]|uniref:Por secretion system C-terminal sorting domain-containing protein n=1 Tax=Chitinophaga sancti TaxID=1004 RepID=A0A1K1R3C5_9BACT|nr:T9SS type A sorting domain-containing protein [Chitinophaga sancti]WQD64358.1 T9SS type A sorting domain-containing protein [Chitinophaga sancti]WQG90018.1 T9SS type A sorting domain-containing protein [Chitinophaga sancti]SFW66086.1 Por secretion system C-terminal sorting domain-containing protein [Chitinophaga sancti]
MKFVTTVIILLLHLSGFAQISVNVYAHLTQTGAIGSLSFDQTTALSSSPLSATGGPVYGGTVSHIPPFALYRNDVRIGSVSSGNIYPVGAIRGDLQFYGDEIGSGYFSVRYVYEMAAPHQVSGNVSSGTQTCANSAISLRSVNNWPLFDDSYVSTSVVWEYNLNGGTAWPGFDSSSATFSCSFLPLLHIPVTSVVNVRFRCRIKAEYKKGTYYSPYSAASEIYTIIPAPPIVKNVSELVTGPACAGKANGWIYLPGKAISSGDPFMYWLLRPGNAITPCTTNCGDLVDWSNGVDSVSKGVGVRGLKAGTYTLWLINSGGSAGNCLTPLKVVIPEVAALSLTTKSVTNIGCNGGRDGMISVQATGGGGYTYTLKTPAGELLNNTNGNWKELAAGTYEVTVSDTTCNEAQRMSITLTEPARISATVNVVHGSCNFPSDARIDLAASGADIHVYSESGILQPALSGLTAGKYLIKITDVIHPACPSWDTTVTITGPAPLSLQLIEADSVSCQGANDGHLQVRGNGNLYQLTGPVQMTNATGDFNHLPPGEYKVQVKRNGTTCEEVISAQYTVYERPPLQVSLQHTPISCHNAANGYLQARVSGGTGAYYYTWEKLEQAKWFATGMQVEDVEPGTYRVTVTDKACSISSDTIVMANPPQLSIDYVGIREAICLEDGAAFDITASGGDGRYAFACSMDHGETYSPLAQIHIAGEYDIRVMDGKGCMAWAPDTYTITLPDSLTIQTKLTDITCRGNDDGSIEVSAAGSDYALSYSLDNENWQASPVFDNLLAGKYTVYVIDDRTCMKSLEVKLSEDTTRQTLKISLIGTQDVYCGNDTTGEIRFITSGGMAPYTYSLDNSNWIAIPHFPGLSAGHYTIQAKDGLGCVTKYAADIIADDPAMQLSARVTPVRCNGTPTGALDITALGGDSIYHYAWVETALSANHISQLKAGNYHLIVTDGKGCVVSGAYTIPEPFELTMKLNTTTVCDGLQDGAIEILADGGIVNYAYSLGDANWQGDPKFLNLAPGNYTVVIRDANDCLLQEQVTLIKRNTQPTVNFLVVSRNNALDTLAVREICLPAPDSVNWEFPPGAEWLGTDLYNAPLIKFSRQGDYWIKMYATFGTCTYNLQKVVNIQPYDPLAIPVYQLPVSIIDTVIVSPNPSQGYFKCRIQLSKKQQTTVSVYDLNGHMIARKQYAPGLLIEDSFDLGKVLSGMYLLRVITENDSKDVPFIVSQF